MKVISVIIELANGDHVELPVEEARELVNDLQEALDVTEVKEPDEGPSTTPVPTELVDGEELARRLNEAAKKMAEEPPPYVPYTPWSNPKGTGGTDNIWDITFGSDGLETRVENFVGKRLDSPSVS